MARANGSAARSHHISDRRVAACKGVLGTARCCSEHYVICFVQALHQNFLSATTEVQASGQPHIRTPSL